MNNVSVKSVVPASDHTLNLAFSNGESGMFQFTDGGTVIWNSQLDIASEYLYETCLITPLTGDKSMLISNFYGINIFMKYNSGDVPHISANYKKEIAEFDFDGNIISGAFSGTEMEPLY